MGDEHAIYYSSIHHAPVACKSVDEVSGQKRSWHSFAGKALRRRIQMPNGFVVVYSPSRRMAMKDNG
jgi:hypothetical protein